jgi:hypothetical protein
LDAAFGGWPADAGAKRVMGFIELLARPSFGD